MKRKYLAIVISIAIMAMLVSCTQNGLDKNDTQDNGKEQTTDNSKDNKEDKDNGKETDKSTDKTQDENKEKPEDSIKETVDIKLDKLIPKENLELKFVGTDNSSGGSVIKANGNTYQAIQNTGKGLIVSVYTIKDGSLYKMYTGDLTEEEAKDISKVDYLSTTKEKNKTILLKEPLKVKTRWDNKEIVEVGKDLKLEGLQLKGSYVKTWEKTVDGNNKTVKVAYYSEGLGCVMYKIMLNDEVVEQSTLSSIVKN